MEWAKAQQIEVNVDLVAAAKRQLVFLAAVDRNRCLYDGPVLRRAIYRYNSLWLPLLAKHSVSPLIEGTLVVPLDCEWIWHCHRLNPVRYKSDCEKLYGGVLDNSGVVSSTLGTPIEGTKEVWTRLYPGECYELDLTADFPPEFSEDISSLENHTSYDLVSAVRRQIPFTYQVSRPHMSHDLFLEEALTRYKGFLYLIKRNKENSISRFCVPTYDIDLMWHSHQLHPASYCKDLIKLLGKVLEHDDTDSDRSKGKKLDVGFSETTKQWEETFCRRYSKAGAMYRGAAPSSVSATPYLFENESKRLDCKDDHLKLKPRVPETKSVEVFLQILGVQNLPDELKGRITVSFSKSQPDSFFNVKQKRSVMFESGEKIFSSFLCEPKGDILFDLLSSDIPSHLPIRRGAKVLGSASLSLEDYLVPISKLSDERWLQLSPPPGHASPKTISLHVAVSFTVPCPAPYVLHMAHSRLFSKVSCIFPLPGIGQHTRRCTSVVTDSGTEIITIQMRSFKKKVGGQTSSVKEVIQMLESSETCSLAESHGSGWSLLDARWSLVFKETLATDSHFCELNGDRMVKLFWGRKLGFEPRHGEKDAAERGFMTAVEFSKTYPYGEAVILIDVKYGTVVVKDERLVLIAVLLAFILSDSSARRRFNGTVANDERLNTTGKEIAPTIQLENRIGSPVKGKPEFDVDVWRKTEPIPGVPIMSAGSCGGCGGGCGSGCGNTARASGCGSGCGGGCGSGCGNMVKGGGGCGGCGGGGCGDGVKSGGCGGCGGGGCGTMVKSSGCGGCGAGGCGSCGAATGRVAVAAPVGA
ncbi:hypothetical protein MLD38_028981 [Melastoma candidum]|uniref:Uncharacterized protein n=1 Tax=Melastoma candidum TaxID=119954 RepID=A0ACB9N4G0_9MYRT|nr:hypothetical protein MLD38_028981 [Melastoma candidum]